MKPIVYVVIAVVAGTAGFAIYRHNTSAPQYVGEAHLLTPDEKVAEAGKIAETAKVADAGDAGTAAAEEETPMPATLPEFTLKDRDGKPRSIRSWPGKSVIVNFWATWCGPCRKEIPFLKELQKAHEKDGIQIVGVAVDDRDAVLKYAADIGIDYPLLIGEDDALEAVGKFGLSSVGFPFTVFSDNQGRIVSYYLGELTRERAAVLLDALARVNRGELTPDAARVVVAKQLQALPNPDA